MLRRAGADCVIDSSATSVRDGVKAQLQAWGPGGTGAGAGKGKGPRGSSGVDVVFDTVGGAQFEDSLKVVAWGGQILVIGFASGKIPSVPANIALVKVPPPSLSRALSLALYILSSQDCIGMFCSALSEAEAHYLPGTFTAKKC